MVFISDVTEPLGESCLCRTLFFARSRLFSVPLFKQVVDNKAGVFGYGTPREPDHLSGVLAIFGISM